MCHSRKRSASGILLNIRICRQKAKKDSGQAGMTSSVAISVPLCLCGYLWSFNFFAKEPKIVYFTGEDAEDAEIQSCFLLSAQLSFPYFSANSAHSAVENCSSPLCLCVSVVTFLREAGRSTTPFIPLC